MNSFVLQFWLVVFLPLNVLLDEYRYFCARAFPHLTKSKPASVSWRAFVLDIERKQEAKLKLFATKTNAGTLLEEQRKEQAAIRLVQPRAAMRLMKQTSRGLGHAAAGKSRKRKHPLIELARKAAKGASSNLSALKTYQHRRRHS